MTGRPWRPSQTGLLWASAVGVYLLVVAGATSAVAGAAAACAAWPLCGAPISTPAVAIALGHRAAAALVGALLLWTAVHTARTATTGRVRAAVAVALVLYPVQIWLGGLLATQGSTAPLPGLHLAVGLGIFGALVLALTWHLRVRSQSEPDRHAEPVGDAPTRAPPATPGDGWTARILAYLRLTKPRLMWLLCLVALAGMMLASLVTGVALSPWTIVTTLAGGVLAIGASGTFNHVLERDRDRHMARTADRPLATEAVPVRRATIFGFGLGGLSVGAFLQVNLAVVALGVTAMLFYSVVYTLLLKPHTVQNTVLGGAAGALPALIGWAAVTGGVGWPGLALAAVVFVWTPAHFYNLALAYRADYERGGFPMMPIVRGASTARSHIMLWLGTTLAAAATLIWLTPLGWIAAITSVALGAVFSWAVVRLHREQTRQAALRAFHASNAYLGAFLAAIVVDALL